MKNILEERSHLGVVTSYGEKYKGVQVSLPEYMSPGIDVSQLPHNIVLQSPDNNDMEPKYPQPGTLVEITYKPGDKGSLKTGQVRHVYRGIHNPIDVPSNKSLAGMGWMDKARKFKPNHHGFPDINATSESNDSGAEKIIHKIVNSKEVSAMADRVGIPSNLVTSMFTNVYDAVKNIHTAKEAASSAMTPSIASMIPGLDIVSKLGDVFSLISSKQKKQINDSLPSKELESGLQNAFSLLGSLSPKSGTNFTHMGQRATDQASMVSSIVSEFSKGDIHSFADIEKKTLSVLKNGLGHKIEDTLIKLAGPFGEIIQTVSASGSITTRLSNEVQQALEGFQGLISSVQSLFGEMLKNSTILTDQMHRLPVDMQSKFSDAMKKIPQNLPKSLTFSRSQ